MNDIAGTTVVRAGRARAGPRFGARGHGSGVRLADATDRPLRDDITETLRKRLRVVAAVLIIAFTLFAVRGHVRGESLLQLLRFAVLLVAALCAVLTRPRTTLSLRQMRAVETLVFLTVALQMIAFQIVQTRAAIASGDTQTVVPIALYSVVTWNLLVMLYGMFIPNTWQRAIRFVVPATLVPTALTLALAADVDAVSKYLYLSFLMSVTAGVCSVLGTHFVNSLQREASEARRYGQYTLSERLGVGGMGEVYLAHHRLLKRPSAIKLIHPDVSGDPDAVRRFEAEVQATATLTHWNTVEIFDYGRTNDGVFYFVMEYLPGLDLGKIVDRHGPMPAGRAVHFLIQVCAALEEAHGIGLIHRDIKPSNVIAAVLGGVHDVAKLVDFGLVQSRKSRGGLPTGFEIAGSPLFMSPEQLGAPDSVDERSDLYSLGITAYFLLSGRYPFRGPSMIHLQQAHCNEVPAPLTALHGVGTALNGIVMRCLEKCPGKRYQSASELRKALLGIPERDHWSDEQARLWWRERGAG